MKNNSVTKEQARIAAEKLLDAVWVNSGISPRLARFLMCAHKGNDTVDFGLFPCLDLGNLAAANTVMQFCVFQYQYGKLLEPSEFSELFSYYESRM